MKNNFIKFVATCVGCMVFLLSGWSQSTTPTVYSNGAALKKSVSNTTVQNGAAFSYTINYSLPAGSSGITIMDAVPDLLTIIGVTNNPTVCGMTPSVSVVGNNVTFSLSGAVTVACGGTFQIHVKSKVDSVCNGDVVRNNVCMYGKTKTSAFEFCTGYVSTTITAIDPWHVFKRSVGTTYIGGACPYATYSDTVEYEIKVYKDVGVQNQMMLSNPIVTDVLPSGATLLSANITSGGGTVTPTTPATGPVTLTWTLPNLSAAPNYNQAVLRVKVRYSPFAVSSTVSNTATLTGSLGNLSRASCGPHSDSYTSCVKRENTPVPTTTAQFAKWYSLAGNMAGCKGTYYIRVYNNGGTVLPTFSFSDVFPAGVTVTKLTVTNQGASAANSLVLGVNGGAGTNYTGVIPPYSSTPINSVQITRNGTLASGQYVLLAVEFTINSSAGATVTNTANAVGVGISPTVASTTFAVIPPQPKVCAFKQICTPSSVLVKPLDVIRYRLRIQNIGSSTLNAGATIMDNLDPNLQYIGNVSAYQAATYTAPCGTTPNWAVGTPTVSGNNLTWTLTSTTAIPANCDNIVYPNCGLTGTSNIPFYFIEFDVRVRDTSGLGQVPNVFTVQGGGLAAPVSSAPATVLVTGAHQYEAEKLVSIDNGATFTASASANAGGTLRYRLNLKNTGTAAFTNITMIDMLPRDAGTSDFFMLNRPLSRGSLFDIKYSAFVNAFISAAISATTRFENTASNIKLPEFNYPLGTGTATWSTATLAPSLNAKMTFGTNSLAPAATLSYDFNAIVDAQAKEGQTACNTFGANAYWKRILNGSTIVLDTLTAVESKAVCINIKPSANCCENTRLNPTPNPCCSQLQVNGECTIKSVKIDLLNGTFTGLNWTCSPVPTGFLGLSTVTLNPSTACTGATINPCFQATGTGTVTITYTVTFTDGTTCVKTETKQCCCTPKITVPANGCRGVALPFVVDLVNCKFANGKWDFGDGTTSSVANTTHTYSTVGGFTAVFYYTNDCGEQKLAFDIGIEDCPCYVKPCFTYKSQNLEAQFSGNAVSNYPIVAYHWDFDDNGAWGTGQSPVHTYAKSGVYKVCVTVYADNGSGPCECKETICMEVTVKEGAVLSGTNCPDAARPAVTPNTQAQPQVPTSSQNLKMSVFPNPVNNNLTVVFNKQVSDTEGGVSQLEVYNLQGQLVKKQALDVGLDETKVAMQPLPVGVYMISLRQNGQIVSTVKVTKN